MIIGSDNVTACKVSEKEGGGVEGWREEAYGQGGVEDKGEEQ